MKYITYFIINTLFLVVCFIVRAEDVEKNIDAKKSNDVVSEEKSVLKNDESLKDVDDTEEDDEQPFTKMEEENEDENEDEGEDENEDEGDEQPEVEDKKYDESNDEQEESDEITNLKEQKSSAITLLMINHKINQLKKSIEVENKAYVMHDKDKNLEILDSIMELIKDETDTDSDKETVLNEENEAKEELNENQDTEQEDDNDQDEKPDSKQKNDIEEDQEEDQEDETKEKINASEEDLDKKDDDTDEETEEDNIVAKKIGKTATTINI